MDWTEFQKLLIYWDCYAEPSLGFTNNGQEKENMSSNYLGKNTFLMTKM